MPTDSRKPSIGKALAEMTSAIGVDDSPERLRTLLADAYVRLGVRDIQAAEVADREFKPARARLQRMAEEYIRDGRSSTWTFSDDDPESIQGVAFTLASDDEAMIVSKKRLGARASAVAAMASLTPTQFENLCKLVLEQMGVEDQGITPYRSDQGIDFYGRLRTSSPLLDVPLYPPVLRNLRMWLIGQAKHYQDGQVATFELRDLVGATALARAKAYSLAGDRYPALEILPADPVISIFLTSGRISSEARMLGRRSGVILMDGDAIVHLLTHAGIGFDAEDRFDPALFGSVIDAPPTSAKTP